MKKRCSWANAAGDICIPYHDEEWGVPVHNDRTLFEFIVLDGFQAGLSWSTILKKRDNFRKAFDRFDPGKIAKYGSGKREALLKQTENRCGHYKCQGFSGSTGIFW